MNSLKMMFRLLRRGLIWLLIAYWVVFVSYTIMHLITGGPGAVVVWYRHIARMPFQWNWGVFLGGQIVILAITVALCFFGRQRPVKSGGVSA
jgi:hypothetical protein